MSIDRHRSLRDQLKPFAAAVRQKFSHVRPVSQVTLQVAAGHPDECIDKARRQVLAWMANRAGRPLPDAAWEGESFDLHEVGAQRAAAVSIESPRYWAARLDDADKDVPQRTWTTEVGLAISPDESAVLFGCRLLCVTRGDDAPFQPSVPGIVRQIIVNVGGQLDGRRISTDPWLVADEQAVDDLVNLICNPARRATVYVFSLPEGDENPENTIIPAGEFLSATIGATHVAVLTGPASYFLSDRVGREFSVYHQAVRTYRPGLRLDSDEPFDHPLALANRIRAWNGENEAAFQKFLIDDALRRTVTERDLEAELPSFSSVQRAALHERRERAADREDATESELLQLALAEIKALKAAQEEEKETYDGLLMVAEEDRRQVEKERDEARQQVSALLARVAYLEHALETGGKARQSEDIPANLADLRNWADRHLAGKVIIHNRAIRAAKKSNFLKPELVYRALLVLRDYYVPMRRDGGIERKRAYEHACAELGLHESSTFAGAGAGAEGDAYFVDFAGRRRELDRHLKGSNARDTSYGFRLYFFWDDDSQCVVVGWLPSHLPTSIT